MKKLSINLRLLLTVIFTFFFIAISQVFATSGETVVEPVIVEVESTMAEEIEPVVIELTDQEEIQPVVPEAGSVVIIDSQLEPPVEIIESVQGESAVSGAVFGSQAIGGFSL